MSQMIMTKFGYMSKVEALILGQLAKEETVKLRKTRSAGGVVICDETKQAAESIR